MQSARGKCFGSTILAEIHMVMEKMHTQDNYYHAGSENHGPNLLDYHLGTQEPQSYGISQKKMTS